MKRQPKDNKPDHKFRMKEFIFIFLKTDVSGFKRMKMTLSLGGLCMNSPLNSTSQSPKENASKIIK